ncbi:MAG TPA: type IVB secretion system protein IcmH/DotU [Dyella sp.]|uniref:type IVB secretion system protein IcmH/DotU n=1 Tax=Dyella sp. TaxID=1869338 RepID=UPI002F956109
MTGERVQVSMGLSGSPQERPHIEQALRGPLLREEPAPNWRNPFIAAAMPSLLQVEKLRESGPASLEEACRRLPGLADAFRSRLASSDVPAAMLERASYLLCTYADEVVHDIQRAAGAHAAAGPALLLSYHGNASGGEDCFSQLQSLMDEPAKNGDLLGFYDLILGLGLRGRYQVIDSGPAQLERLREKLAAQLGRAREGHLLLQDAASDSRVRRGPRPWQVCIGLVFILAGVWAVLDWQLERAETQLRIALAQWPVPELPPAPPVAPRERLPEAVQRLADEGWLEVVKEENGWLLLFTSDQAFASASAALSKEYKVRIGRLGEALAPWPGDLLVIGHTDTQPLRPGRYRDNQALSLARAATVRDALLETANQRFVGRSITAVGKGDAEPIADDATAEGRLRNRRVDIHWNVAHTGERP